MRHNILFCFGLGYTALALSRIVMQQGWEVRGTCQSPEKQAVLQQEGIKAYRFAEDHTLSDPDTTLDGVTHILHSIPPAEQGDSVLLAHKDIITTLPSLQWVGYLSTTGVYGDHQGGWVDETTSVNPPNARSRYRAEAEQAWLALEKTAGVPVHIFRLSGIYGPGRSALEAVKNGTARRIDKPGQYFSRIHVEDIVQVLLASIASPNPGSIYNLADDAPAAQGDVVAYACQLLGVEPPPLVPFAKADLSKMARSFYQSNRRVNNSKIKQELGVRLKYPRYEEGLESVLKTIKA